MARKEVNSNFADERNAGRQEAGVKRTHKVTEVEPGVATDDEKNFLKNKARELSEESVKTIEESIIELGVEDLEPIIQDVAEPPTGPKNEKEKAVWEEWNEKFDDTSLNYFHEELPTHKEIDTEEVPTVKEVGYGEQKVQEAPALEEEGEGWPVEDKDIEEEIPAEFKDGKWVASQKKVELPSWLQEGHEDEGKASDVEEVWKAVTDDLVRQEARNQGSESKGTTHLAFEVAPYDDLEPPTVDEFMAEFDSERAETVETPAFQQFESNIDAVASGQFDARKKETKGFFKRFTDTAKKIGGVASELGYKADELRKSAGLENLGGKMVNILARSKNLTESSLSKIAGSVMAAGKEAEYFFKTPRKEKKLRTKYKKELEGVKTRIDLREKYPVPGVEGEEELEGLRRLRNIITEALG